MYSKNTHTLSSLSYFLVNKYEHTKDHGCDFSALPRPFTSIAIMLSGEGSLDSGFDKVNIKKGDLLFIPFGQRYISTWHGFPDISYLTIHFNFEQSLSSFSPQNFTMQKISGLNFEAISGDFEYIHKCFLSEGFEIISALSKFYSFYYDILPKLVRAEKPVTQISAVQSAINYIEANYTQNFKVESLAKQCHLSTSRFFYLFKEATGYSPVEYKNYIRIKKAIQLMNTDISTIEDISTALGFSDAAYFRRVFKNITGRNPKAYQHDLYHL